MICQDDCFAGGICARHAAGIFPVLRSYGLMRQSRWLSCSSVIHLVPGVSAGCCQPLLPTASSRLYSANLSPDAWSPTPTVPSSAFACFFLKVIGLPKGTKGSASRLFRERDFPAGYFSRLQTFRYVQASEFARLSDRSYHCEFPHRAAETFTSGHIVLRCLRTLRICYPSAQAIDGERTFTFQDLQPCRLLQCLTSLADGRIYFALC